MILSEMVVQAPYYGVRAFFVKVTKKSYLLLLASCPACRSDTFRLRRL